jgi:hypothetical protein
MEPRFTLSVQMVLRSTVGAAGFSREMPTVAPINTTTAMLAHRICRRRF